MVVFLARLKSQFQIREYVCMILGPAYLYFTWLLIRSCLSVINLTWFASSSGFLLCVYVCLKSTPSYLYGHCSDYTCILACFSFDVPWIYVVLGLPSFRLGHTCTFANRAIDMCTHTLNAFFCLWNHCLRYYPCCQSSLFHTPIWYQFHVAWNPFYSCNYYLVDLLLPFWCWFLSISWG